MNSFDLSRNWFNFAFENPDIISPGHAAIYFFAIEHCNRLGNKEKFGFPTTMAMEALGIKSYKTYISLFNDLVSWGFIKLIEKSKNQYSANIIAIVKNTKANTKALDKALIKHSIKQVQSTDESIVSIIKQSNNETSKQETNKILFDNFRKKYPGTKRGLETEFENFLKKHKDWESVLNLLLPAVDKQIKLREIKKDKNLFIPEWKNLQTWINQRCWEEEVEIINEVKQLSR